MSLNDCLRKLSDAVTEDDAAAIRDLAAQYREDGMDAKAAATRAAREILQQVMGERKALTARIEDMGGTVPTRSAVAQGVRQATVRQSSTERPGARGYFDPNNSMIRLTEASDLSTFLHEFAHFMYEMELRAGTPMVQDIHAWFKRNAADVAREANGYLAQEQQGAMAQDSDAFRQWFGNSKVVDAQGRPLIVKHGSREAFTEFRKKRGGMYFTADGSVVTAIFTEDGRGDIGEYYLSLQNPFDARWKNMNDAQKAELRSIIESVVVDSDIEGAAQKLEVPIEDADPFEVFTDGEFFWGYGRALQDEVLEAIKLRGYDGVIFPDVLTMGEPHVSYVAFEPSQIKSATDNAGTFDPNDPSILRQDVPMDRESRLARAREMGFDTDTVYYHSTKADFDAFEDAEGKGQGFHFGTSDQANMRAAGSGKNVLPVYLRTKKTKRVKDAGQWRNEIKKAKKAGYDSIVYLNRFEGIPRERFAALKEQGYTHEQLDTMPDAKFRKLVPEAQESIVVFDPADIRSINAAFVDGESSNLLAQGDQPASSAPGPITEQDVQTFLDASSTGDQAKDAALRRAVHEQFARGFETYLMEGKAPSVELRNAFRAFARWLVELYQRVRGNLNVNLDDQMRQVFDRLIATDEQIAAAEARARVRPLFTDAAMAGMTEEEFTKYQQQKENAKDASTETLRDKLIGQLTRQTKAWWKEELADKVDEEMVRLQATPTYRAIAALRGESMKLDHTMVKATVGETVTDKRGRTSTRIPAKLNGMTVKGAQGVTPDDAAAFLGFDSGDQMLRAIIAAPSLREAAETAAQERMLAEHGDILNDGTIEQQADEALQNEDRAKLLLTELKHLAKGTSVPTVDRAAIKAMAEENIARLPYTRIFPGKYRRAEIRAAQEAAVALKEGDHDAAARAKLRQVMNFYLGKAATEARADVLRITDSMGRYSRKTTRAEIEKAGNSYMEQIDRILARFEFRPSRSMASVESLNTWAKTRMEEDGDALVLSPEVLNESFVTHWKNIPFGQLQGIADSVKNIEHVARYSNKIERMGEEVDYKTLVARWTEHMDRATPTQHAITASVADQPNKLTRVTAWSMAWMTKIPWMASWLDGGERVGMTHQILIQPFTDALHAKYRLWEQVGRPVLDLLKNRSKEMLARHNRKYFIPEIAGRAGHTGNLMGHEILAVALNTGNDSNLRKMLLGEGWASPDNDAEISFDNPRLQAVLAHMTAEDWTLVQTIWDQIDQLYQPLAEVHRRTTGLTPPKVQASARTVLVDGETLEVRGGYYPVKYDPARSQRAEENQARQDAQVESMFSGGGSLQASVSAGATNERTGYYAPISLNLGNVVNHIEESVHYITHHDAVRETNKLIRDPKVGAVIRAKLGEDEYKNLRPWLNDIAKDGRSTVSKSFIDAAIGRLRFGLTIGAMGFKASTGIMQILGLSNTAGEVGINNLRQAVRMTLGDPEKIRDAWQFAVQNSKVLDHRAQTMDRELRAALENLEGKRGWGPALAETSMKHISLIQTYMVDLPSWYAAYIKEMNESGDETKAFQYADWVIEQVQGSGATKDMAALMRGQSETHRAFTMFMTFFSSLWNMERDLARGARFGRYSPTTVAAKMMFFFAIPVLAEMLLRDELDFGDDGEDDGEETELQRYLLELALYPVASVPFVRDAVSGAVGGYDYTGNPIIGVIGAGVSSLPEIVNRSFTDEEITKGQVKGASQFIGAAAGIPGINQAWNTGEHLYQVLEEGEELSLRQLLLGPDRAPE